VTVTGLFDGLFDDAALFPPGDAPMAVAVPAHRELNARLGSLVGPLVVPVTRLDEFLPELRDGDQIAVSLIATVDDLPSAVARAVADPRLTPSAVEVAGVTDGRTAATAVQVLGDILPSGMTAAVELPRTGARDVVLDALTGTGHRAKLRTGGPRAELFPDAAELTGTLHACAVRKIAFKCTAGLHHAVQHTDPATGFAHHGFLNLLLAADALAADAPASAAADWLHEDRPGVLGAYVTNWPADRIARARAAFTSFGTCSVLEPVDDLVALGLLPFQEECPA